MRVMRVTGNNNEQYQTTSKMLNDSLWSFHIACIALYSYRKLPIYIVSYNFNRRLHPTIFTVMSQQYAMILHEQFPSLISH